jgi:hypothetical protein
MLFIIRLNLLVLLICIISRCFAVTPPRGTKKEVDRALAAGVRALSFDSDDEDNIIQRSPPRTRIRGPFSDDEDEGHGASSSGTSSGISGQSSGYRRPNPLTFSESGSDYASSVGRGQMSATSGVFDEIDQFYKRKK